MNVDQENERVVGLEIKPITCGKRDAPCTAITKHQYMSAGARRSGK
jgi:hypothetical protein